ncbi:hypothetical protein AC520_0379 [Enterobacter sp. OLF]|nr:hypothetical protein AC520_0379 [Enterobacter sp. OLF]
MRRLWLQFNVAEIKNRRERPAAGFSLARYLLLPWLFLPPFLPASDAR